MVNIGNRKFTETKGLRQSFTLAPTLELRSSYEDQLSGD